MSRRVTLMAIAEDGNTTRTLRLVGRFAQTLRATPVRIIAVGGSEGA